MSSSPEFHLAARSCARCTSPLIFGMSRGKPIKHALCPSCASELRTAARTAAGELRLQLRKALDESRASASPAPPALLRRLRAAQKAADQLNTSLGGGKE